MDVARQYLAGSNGVDGLPSSSVGFSRLCDDVAPVVTGQGSYVQEHTPRPSSGFWLGVGVSIAFMFVVRVVFVVIDAM
jgi:hypothetical protein